jgi:hypothetical protein
MRMALPSYQPCVLAVGMESARRYLRAMRARSSSQIRFDRMAWSNDWVGFADLIGNP